MVWTEVSLLGFLNLPLPVLHQKSSTAWQPHSTAVQVSNFGKVPRTVLTQQSISFLVPKQNIQEVLQGSSTQLEMRLTQG